MQVRDIMKPARWTIGPEDKLARAERLLAHRRLHELLVVEGGAVVGVLSDRDVLDFRGATRETEWWHTPVRRAMQPIAAAATPDESIGAAIDRLASSTADVLPIVDRGFLVGQLTAADLFEAEHGPAGRHPRGRPGALTVADAMTAPAIAIGPGDSLVDAARRMVEHAIRHLPVVEEGVVIGMVSDRDIRTFAGDPARFVETGGDGARALVVRDVMTPDVLTIHPRRPLLDAADELADERLGAIPVVDGDGRLVGIVSYVDVLRALAS